MKGNRIASAIGWTLIALIGLTAAGLLWSVNYSAAVYVVSGQSNIWNGFTSGDLTLPALQAWTYWSLPVVHKLLTLSMTALAVEAAAIGGGGYLLVAMPWKARPPAEGARLATLRDLEKAQLLEGQPGKSLLLGTFKGREVRYSGPSHIYVNGPSRSGKGRGFILPNLLEWSGSAIVFDPKQENCDLTVQARLALGQNAYLISPGSRRSHRWNPLDFVRPWPERATDLSNIAANLIELPKTEPHWAQTGRMILAGLLGYVLDSVTMEGRRNIRSAFGMFSTGRSLADVFQTIIDREGDLHPFILSAFRTHIAQDPRQRPSFESNVTTALKAWNNDLFAAMTSASDFDIRELRRNPFTVFIAAPVSDFSSAEPIIRLFIQQVHDILLRGEPGPDEPHKVLFILDEFYQFKRFPEIIDRAPIVASYQFQIALIAQNIPQIDERYSRATREALLGNMDIKLFVAFGDKTSGDIASESMGKRYVEKTGWSDSRGSGPFATRNRQGSWVELPLMTSDQLQRMDDRKTVLNIRGHSSAVLDKLNFYKDKKFVDYAQQIWRFSPLFGAPVLEVLPEWPLFEAPAKALQSRLEASGRFSPAWKLGATRLAKLPAWGAGPGREIANKMLPVAKTVFADWRRFMVAVEHAMIAPDQELAEVLVTNLKTRPQACGALRGSASVWIGRKRSQRREALAAIPSLVSLVARGRLDVNRRLANAALSRGADSSTEEDEDSGAKGPETPSPSGAPQYQAQVEEETGATIADATAHEPQVSASLDDAASARTAAEQLLKKINEDLAGTTAAQTIAAARAGLTVSGRQLKEAIDER